MNPLSLLTKGQTLKGLGRPGRYKLTPQCALPNFQTTNRTRTASPFVAPAAEPKQTSLFEPPPAPAEIPIAAPAPVIPKTPISPLPNQPGLWSRAVQLILGHKRRLSPLATVQTELALEKVTVLRNDLNEDDLEVVLVQRKVGTDGKPLARVTKTEMTGEAWIRLTAPFRKKNNAGAPGLAAEKKASADLGAPVLANKP